MHLSVRMYKRRHSHLSEHRSHYFSHQLMYIPCFWKTWSMSPVFFLIGCCEAPTVTKSFVAGHALQDSVITKDILGFYLFLFLELVSSVKRVVIFSSLILLCILTIWVNFFIPIWNCSDLCCIVTCFSLSARTSFFWAVHQVDIFVSRDILTVTKD